MTTSLRRFQNWSNSHVLVLYCSHLMSVKPELDWPLDDDGRQIGRLHGKLSPVAVAKLYDNNHVCGVVSK
jgi:hypothetical protein